MEIKKTGKVSMRTLWNSGAALTLTLEEEGEVSISGWRGKDNKISQYDFVVKCRDELTKFIEALDGKVVYQDRKWYEFWRK